MKAWVCEQPRDLGREFQDHLDPARTAVISIDRHRGHLDDSPDCPCPCCPCPAPRARALGMPIVHVKSVLRADGSDDVNGIASAWRRTFPLHVGAIPNASAHALEGSRWTEWVTRVAPEDLRVENKRRLSAFYPTDLDF